MLVEDLEIYRSPQKLSMRRPPWKCSNIKCNSLIYDFKYIDSGVSIGCFEVKCPECGNIYYG